MKSKITTILMMAALVALWGCSHHDDDPDIDTPETPTATTVSKGKPQWKIDWQYNEQAPQWTSPNPKEYENWMIIMPRLEEELAAVASEDDLMGAFINGELRAFNKPSKNPEGDFSGKGVKFILKILGNEKSNQQVTFSLKYYSQKLKQMFTLEGVDYFVNEKVWGIDQDLILPLTHGSSKYPIVMQLAVKMNLAKYGLTSQPGDMLAVMVGDECRGIQTVENEITTTSNVPVTVFGREENEGARLLYYSGNDDAVYDLGATFPIKTGTRVLSIQ